MSKSSIDKGDLSFKIFNYVLMAILMLIVVYPLYYILIASFSDPNAVNLGLVIFKPVQITFEGYQRIFSDTLIWSGYRNSLIYAIAGTAISVSLTIPAAFALSRKELPGRKLLMYLITFTMFFNGGMIPTYFVVQNLGFRNTIWSLLLPVAVNTYFLIISKSFFQSTIPDELIDAAFIDGASYFKLFFKIILALSKPIIAVMVLYYAVAQWNSYFQALLYLSNEKLFPLQLVLRNILVNNDTSSMTEDIAGIIQKQRVQDLIKYGVVIVSSVPVMILYPFVQKHFVHGVMIGSIKG